MVDFTSAEAIFFAALDKETGQERDAYLDEACGSDKALRQQVERLLAAQPRVGSFLKGPPLAPAATIDGASIAEKPGTVIGPYKLLQQIGEGGMGIVFMAEQTQPVQRKVALKIIKPGMDSAQVIARFEAERQALAMMDHQNIARVLDAGTTSSGRPYFVMELVHGVPITHFCDERQTYTAPAARAVRAGLPGDPACPSEGHHPPRHQTVQRLGDDVRRQASAQGNRLRRGQGD